MCDQATQQILESIVSAKTTAREMFTALDISREAQQQHSVQYRHNELKGDVHRIYQDGLMNSTNPTTNSDETYQRTLIEIPGVPGKVYLYHFPGADINTYRSKYAPAPYQTGNQQGASSQQALQSISVPPLTPPVQGISTGQTATATVTAVAPANATDYQICTRNRLWIPQEFVKKIGAVPGQHVQVLKDGSSLKLQLKVPANPADVVTSYKVDRHSNICLSKSALEAVGLEDEKYFDILDINGDVVVKKA